MINLYSEKEIEILRRGGRILARILEEVAKKAQPGITTEYLNKVAEGLVFSFGAEPAFKGFNNYPAVLCASINEEIVHALPSKRKLQNGDILSLDLGIRYKNYCTDMAITVPVGKINKEAKKLIKITKKSLEIGIKQAKPGKHIGDIGWAIQNYAEKNNFQVIQELVGHGVGKSVHEEPQVPNYGPSTGLGIKLKSGMVLAIEPMISVGDSKIEKCDDGFCYCTKDKSLSCHFEHTIAITKTGPIVLTR